MHASAANRKQAVILCPSISRLLWKAERTCRFYLWLAVPSAPTSAKTFLRTMMMRLIYRSGFSHLTTPKHLYSMEQVLLSTTALLVTVGFGASTFRAGVDFCTKGSAPAVRSGSSPDCSTGSTCSIVQGDEGGR